MTGAFTAAERDALLAALQAIGAHSQWLWEQPGYHPQLERFDVAADTIADMLGKYTEPELCRCGHVAGWGPGQRLCERCFESASDFARDEQAGGGAVKNEVVL